MPYTKTPWVDDAAPYIDSTNLNNIEDGIESVTNAHEALAATSNNIDVLASKYFPRGNDARRAKVVDLGGEVEHGHAEIYFLADGGTERNHDQYNLSEMPILRYTPDTSFYLGQSLDFTFEPRYTPGSSYFSGRLFTPKALPSSGNWNGHIEDDSVLGFTNGGSAKLAGEGSFTDNTTAAEFYGNLGEWGRNDGRFPIIDVHREDDDFVVNNYRGDISGYYEYADDSVLSTLAADDIVFCLANNAQSNADLFLDSFQVGSIDLANNRLNLREGAGHRPDNRDYGHVLLNKGFKQNSVTDLGGATIYNSEGGTGGDWKLNVEDGTTAWPDEYVGSAIILDDGSGNKKYVVLANNQGSSTSREGNVDSGFVDQTAYTEFDVWFWYDTTTGDSTDSIAYTPAIGVSEWGLSKYDSRIASSGATTNLDFMPYDGTTEMIDEGYYRRTFVFTNNLGSFPIGTSIILGQTGDFTFTDWTKAVTVQGNPVMAGGYGSIYESSTDAYTFDGTVWYEMIGSAEVGSRFGHYNPGQMRPVVKLDTGVWYYNDDTGIVFDHNPNGTFDDRTNFDAACLDVNWAVSTTAAGKSLPSDVAFAWADYSNIADATGSYRSEAVVTGNSLLRQYVYNNTTNAEPLMYTLDLSRLISPPTTFSGYAGGWTKCDGDTEWGTFRGTQFIANQDYSFEGPIKVVIYGKLIS